MQDPGGDGKIVYLFLPLYQVRMTVSVDCFLPMPRLAVQRTVIVALDYLNTGSMAHTATCLYLTISSPVSTNISVALYLHDNMARLVEQFMFHHVFIWLRYYQATQSALPQLSLTSFWSQPLTLRSEETSRT